MDLDDSKIDDDLDKLLQHIKEDQQNSMDAPDSPKDPGETSHRYFHFTPQDCLRNVHYVIITSDLTQY